MTSYITPFTQETTKKIFSSWLRIINQKESGSIINIPKRDQLYRIKWFLRDYPKIKPALLDLTAQIVEDPEDVDRLIDKSRVVFVLDSDQLLDEKISFLSYLDSFYHRKNISFLYFFQKNISSSAFTKKLSSYTTLFQNIILYPLFEKKDTTHFINYIQQFFKTKLPEKVKKSILEQCAGSPWLIKQAVRHFSQTKDVKTLFSHDAMKMKLNILYQELSPYEKTVVEKIVKKDLDFSAEEKETLNYLLKTKLIKKTGRNYNLTIPLLTDFIKNELAGKTQISLNGREEIIINGVIVNPLFSKKEKGFLKYCLKNPNIIISREKIAAVIWGANCQNQYTDWALDQFMRRLRSKLLRLGLSSKLIQTKKNQGYVFAQ